MKHTWNFLLISSISLLVVCGKNQVEKESSAFDLEDSEQRNKIVLEVQESSYSNSDLVEYIRHITGEDINKLKPGTLSRIFDSFVEEKILLADAQTQNISLTQVEKKNYLAKLTQWLNGNEQQTVNEGEHEFLFEKLLVEKLVVELVRDITVSSEEISEYYIQNKREFLRPEQVKVSQILVHSEDKAIEIFEAIKDADEEEFKKAAGEVSEGIEATKGGEMGVFELGQLPFDMEKVIFSLQEGEVSQVVESSYGYHIFRLDKKLEPKLIPEEQASSEIELKILDQKIKKFLSGYIVRLKDRLTWKVHAENLLFPYQRNDHE